MNRPLYIFKLFKSLSESPFSISSPSPDGIDIDFMSFMFKINYF